MRISSLASLYRSKYVSTEKCGEINPPQLLENVVFDTNQSSWLLCFLNSLCSFLELFSKVFLWLVMFTALGEEETKQF